MEALTTGNELQEGAIILDDIIGEGKNQLLLPAYYPQ